MCTQIALQRLVDWLFVETLELFIAGCYTSGILSTYNRPAFSFLLRLFALLFSLGAASLFVESSISL